MLSGANITTAAAAVTDIIQHISPWKNGRHFPDDIFNNIFMNEKFCILIQISLKFVPKGIIDNIQAMVQIMHWRR